MTQHVYSSIVGQTFYPHQWRMGDRKVYLYACVDCGHVQAIKEEDE